MKQEEWKRLVSEHETSGLSIARFCRERGVSESAFGYWRQKSRAAKQPGRFARIVTDERVTLELSGGKTVSVSRNDLAAVLEALCAG